MPRDEYRRLLAEYRAFSLGEPHAPQSGHYKALDVFYARVARHYLEFAGIAGIAMVPVP